MTEDEQHDFVKAIQLTFIMGKLWGSRTITKPDEFMQTFAAEAQKAIIGPAQRRKENADAA